MLTVGRMVLHRLADYIERSNNGVLTQLLVAVLFVGMMGSAIITELIGIHTIFGAFLFGAVMPNRSIFVRDLAEKTEDFTVVFLLPIFFAYTGLRTQFGLLNESSLWLDCVLVIAAATLGKFGGSTVAAKLAGLEWLEAAALGVLMNTRGLMELIILNIGLDLGVISPALFAMMVIMALVTTFATTPILAWVYPQKMFGESEESPVSIPVDASPAYSILVPVANPESQKGLVDLALALATPEGRNARIYPINMVRLGDEYTYASLPERADEMVLQSQQQLTALVDILATDYPGVVHPLSQLSDDIPSDLGRIAREAHADLVLLGWHRPTFVSDPLGGNVRRILEAATTDVAVFVDRGLALPLGSRIIVPYGGTSHDFLALELALRLALSHGANLTLMQTTPLSKETRDLVAFFQERVNLECVNLGQDPIEGMVEASRQASLLVVGTSPQWGTERHLFGPTPEELMTRCSSSLLIARHHRSVTPHLESLRLTSSPVPTLTVGGPR